MDPTYPILKDCKIDDHYLKVVIAHMILSVSGSLIDSVFFSILLYRPSFFAYTDPMPFPQN